MKKSTLKKLIQVPLAFHHQDLHERLDHLEQQLAKLEGLILALLKSTNP